MAVVTSAAYAPQAPTRRKTFRYAVFLAVWVASAVYVAGFVRRGWIPLDEGTLAMAAEKVSHGQLLHRDFEGGYTGALGYLHALGFAILGTRLVSMRVVLFAVFLAFVPAVYAILRRFWDPLPAAAVTALAVAWSVPNYFASMPSWYNLFFALFGTVAALRFVETDRRVWLFIAGICAGISILVKITGLYFVAALLLFLVHAVQTRRVPVRAAPDRRRPWTFLIFLIACAAALVAAIVGIVRTRAAPMEVLQYVVPAVALAGYLVWFEASNARGGSVGRFNALFGLFWPLGAGILLPVAVFLVPYASSGSLGSVASGLAVNTRLQLANTKSMMFLPPLDAFWPAIPYLALLAVPAGWPRRRPILSAGILAACLAAVFLATSRTDVYQDVWKSAQPIAVVAVLAGCRFLVDPGGSVLPAGRRSELFLLLCVTAMLSLVQYPFAAPHYFFYVAPAAIVAIAALVASDRLAPRPAHAAVLAFYLAFALGWTNRSSVFTVGHHPEIYRADALLPMDRGGLRVDEENARIYGELVDGIRAADPEGSTLFATPDCPEVYFLAGRDTPITAFMDFQGPLYEKDAALLHLIEAKRIRVIVINAAPTFSHRLRPRFRAELERRFPLAREIGPFTLRWKASDR